jgi:hypothetical protein
MQATQYKISIPNLPALQEAMANYPSISQPVVQAAVVGSQALLAKYTTASTVPVITGYLLQNWGFDVGNYQARWYPKATYAPYVEFGTPPHIIRPVNAKVLANARTGQIFGTLVHHPGTKPNPFMERIVSQAQPDVDALFITALDKINLQISEQANAT